METTFTPLASFGGGALIGGSALMLWAGLGRIAGISGIVARLLVPVPDGGAALRAAFVAGLIGATFVFLALFGAPAHDLRASTPVIVIAGLLVGYGAAHGGGCTSGHGVCGLSRLSWRSLVATATFMAVAAVTVFVTRHLLGWGGSV